jgi:hypothetical protein
MKKVIILLLLLMVLPVRASHIVGGEFELIHVQGNTYRLNLIIYFDVLNGLPGAKDLVVNAAFFRKKNNTLVFTQQLSLSQESRVPYTQPSCSNGEVVTDRLIYTALVTLAPASFNDPEGYYVSWQRCCRNYSITNIFSENPQSGAPGNQVAGQTFYLEFPPVVRDGKPFINSSPRLFPPLNDFACPRRPYYVDFAGVDDDGDSLVYSLATPLNTRSPIALPPASPAPYPLVTWRNGFSETAMVGGTPDLRISPSGFLTVTPKTQGIYVFAVKVDEYRAGEKIGETRRDFQMLVVDACPVAVPPVIVGKRLTDAAFSFREKMSISFSNEVSDDNRCMVVQISDPDSNSPDDNFAEKISIRAIPLNFRKTGLSEELLPRSREAVLTKGSTVDFKICFPACPYFEGGPYEVGIVAFDDACSLPLTDTLRITVNIQPPVNRPVQFDPPNRVMAQLLEGESQSWDFSASDLDNDTLVFSVLTEGFSLEASGMKIQSDIQPGRLRGTLSWEAFCDIADFTNRTVFPLRLLVDDRDGCKFNKPDTLVFNLGVTLPGNADPVISSTLDLSGSKRIIETLTRPINSDLTFTVFGKDQADNDRITLRMVPKGFSLAPAGIQFSRATGQGAVESTFNWKLRCLGLDPAKKDLYEFDFIVVDSTNKCRLRKADTLSVSVRVINPINSRPVLVARQQGQSTPLVSGRLEVTLGDPIELLVQGLDGDVFPDRDQLTLELESIDGEVPLRGFRFEPVAGKSPISSTFSWAPDCSIFIGNDFENEYELTFRLSDDRCYTAETVRQKIQLVVRDVVSRDDEFIPPNVFTPNGDAFNEYYAMQLVDPVTGAVRNILPPDNCVRRFESVRIINRWGQTVFQSRDRDFQWTAENQPEGVYFFLIAYSDREFKGAVSVRR